jgi:hypothetical protein
VATGLPNIYNWSREGVDAVDLLKAGCNPNIFQSEQFNPLVVIDEMRREARNELIAFAVNELGGNNDPKLIEQTIDRMVNEQAYRLFEAINKLDMMKQKIASIIEEHEVRKNARILGQAIRGTTSIFAQKQVPSDVLAKIAGHTRTAVNTQNEAEKIAVKSIYKP